MRKLLTVLLVLSMVLSMLPMGVFAAEEQGDTPAQVAAGASETLSSTLLRSGVADPWLFMDGGYYYLTMTGTSRIAMFKSETLAGLGSSSLKLSDNIVYTSAEDPTVTELFGEGATLSGTWSPEVYYFSEEQYPGYAGWYMFLALRKNTGDSSTIQMVVLKSTTGDPKGPYGHPVTGEVNRSQPILDKNGNVYSDWGCGMGCVTIPEGQYKGLYTMWVTEVGRGEGLGNFYQKIMINKMSNPWTMARTPGVITTPTQDWEYAGSSSTHPRVVEGATAVYGAHGEVFLTYSGSGYWSNYGLGQLTWTGGDPLLTSSWHKLETDMNPIFSAVSADNVRGAGHASFLRDAEGNGFLCYHAYPYVDGTKASARSAYLEPYYIDYSQWNGVSYGVIHCGVNDNRVPANTSTKVTFVSEGGELGVPTVSVSAERYATLSLSAANAQGYTIYRSTDGETFSYLGYTETSTFTDTQVADGKTYYYRAYSYRNEENSTVSQTVSVTVPGFDDAAIRPSFTATQTADSITLNWGKIEGVDGYKIYRKAPGETTYTALKAIYDPEATSYTDAGLASGSRYGYLIHSFYKDGDGVFHFSASSGGKLVYTQPTAPNGTTEYDYSGGIKITITDPVTCTGYAYARSDDDGHSFNVIYTGPEDNYVDHDVEVGKTYYYRVYAYAGDVSVRSASTGAGSIVAWPAAPKIESIMCNADGSVTFSWGAVEGATGYKLWRKLPNTSSWTTLVVETTDLSYTDTTAEAGVTYVYAVQARQKVGSTTYFSKLTDVSVTITADADCVHSWADGICGKCGAICGHSYSESVTTKPTCTDTGVKTYTCGTCGDSYTETVAATGHSFADGVCSECGAADPDYVPVVNPTITPAFPTMALEEEVKYNIYFTVSDLGDYTVNDMGLLVFDSKVANPTYDTAKSVVPGATISDGYFMVQSGGIPAKEMADDPYFVIYIKLADGSYAYSMIFTFNAVDYVQSVLASSAYPEGLKKTCVALMNYGADAQVYFGYKTDSLMNSFLTADQQAMVSEYNSSMVSSIVKADASKVGEFASVSGGFSNIVPSVSLEGAFAVNYYFIPGKTVESDMTFYCWDAKTYNSVDVLTKENAINAETLNVNDAGQYLATFEGIAAKDLDSTVYVAAVYESNGVTYCTGVLAVSVSVLSTMQMGSDANLTALAEGIIVYGDCAKAYFSN